MHGFEVDDVCRDFLVEAGYGEFFVHRTGHSMDLELHGSGPNLDNLETRDNRLLVPGVGFSIEPGVYLPDDVGIRSEINVHFGVDGPEVTPPRAAGRDPAVAGLTVPLSILPCPGELLALLPSGGAATPAGSHVHLFDVGSRAGAGHAGCSSRSESEERIGFVVGAG